MRRSIFTAQPAARAMSRALSNQPTRRAFASTPATPIEPSKEQAHPIGPFYESVLRTPSGPFPKVKPEEPPVTSQSNPKSMPDPAPAPAEKPPAEKEKPTEKQAPNAEEKPSTKPAPAPPKEEKPKPSPKAAAVEEEKPVEAPIAEEKKPLKRTRKPRSTGTKSVDSSPHSSSAVSSAQESPLSSSSSSTTIPPTPKSGPNPAILLPSDQPPTSSSKEELPSNTASEQNSQRTRVIFGSSLAGPAERAERLARIKSESRLINGVLVPPKPEEPDNCCMSGCVNCVWDRFRDEMEDWAAKSKLAEARMEAATEVGEQVGVTQDSIESTNTTSTTMEDDGGGSVANWDADGKTTRDLWDEELYKNVPVGIREFMKQEKKLKEKHAREGTLGG